MQESARKDLSSRVGEDLLGTGSTSAAVLSWRRCRAACMSMLGLLQQATARYEKHL